MKYYFLLSVIILLISPSVFAQEVALDSAQTRKEKFDDWKWRISPYAWVPAITGQISTPPIATNIPEPLPPLIDFKFLLKDIRTHLKFLSVMSAEYRSERYLVAARFDALVIDAKPVLIFESQLDETTVDFAIYGSDLMGGYRFWRHQNFELDGFAGLRFLHLKTGVNISLFGNNMTYQVKETYWDPLLALRFLYMPWYRVEWMLYSDFTPFALNGRASFQAISVLTYQFNPHFFLSPGYRFVGHNKRDPEVTYFDGNIRGFYLRIGFQF